VGARTMTQDFRPSWRRSWAERHPVLSEAISIILASVGCIAIASAFFYAI
jgi:hypothetical protein